MLDRPAVLAASSVRRNSPRRAVRTRGRTQAAASLILAGIAALAAATLPAPAAAAAASATAEGVVRSLPDFQRECERLVETTDMRGGTVAISVVDADLGTVLVRLSDEEAMIPASTMKLLTTGAALHVLGPDFRFRTRLLRDGDRLVVLGDGDPGFGDPVLLEDTPVPASVLAPAGSATGAGAAPSGRRDLEVDELVDLWVDSVVRAGMKQVRELVIDDRIFDREFVHPTWPQNQLSRRYCAGVAGLNFHSNLLTFYPYPVRGGGATPGQSVPRAGFLDIENSATGDRSRPGTASVERRLGTDQLILMGNVRTQYEFPIQVTVNNPPEFFARLLTERLRQAGVQVGAWRLADADGPPAAGSPVAPDVVTPLVRVLERTNTNSHNLSAEALLKRVAAARGVMPATYVGGASMVRDVVRERLADERLDSRLRVADGSGLSRENKVPPALMTAWLRSFHRDAELAPVLRSSLAVMGRTGTLERRLGGAPPAEGQRAAVGARYVPRGTVVRAKSGTIDSVSGLSGYVIGPRRTLCFSIMVNGYSGSSATARDLQDRIVMLLAQGLADES
jgi:D-alanyl-D-alanine carboxypeptidase/D-alanyl-D-alanine-endopeptidase (penicillin-binding protein 4)